MCQIEGLKKSIQKQNFGCKLIRVRTRVFPDLTITRVGDGVKDPDGLR